MKTKIGLVLLAVLSVGLAIGLITTKKQAEERQKNDANTILDFSNQWSQASLNVDELRQVNLTLNNDLATNHLMLTGLSNNLESVSESISNVQKALLSAQDQISGQSNRIADLEAQNKTLDDRAALLTQQAVDMTNRIAALNAQINDTMMQLATSQTNNSNLEKQLQQLVELKAELEHKFNSLEAVRDQVKKLRDEIVEARRLLWMKEGTDVQLKGAQQMVKMRDAAFKHSPTGTNYGLDVEIGSDGSVRAIPPLGNSTNLPATNAPAH